MHSSSLSHAIRGCFITFKGNPFLLPLEETLHVEDDGLILIRDGIITHCGSYENVRHHVPASAIRTHYPNCIISAGFIDTHAHYPQLPAMASWGKELLEWLKQYIFPMEQNFSNPDYARKIARFFLNELLRNGTTTASVYCTVHPESVSAFFQESEKSGTRMIAGKVLMDRNAPEGLRDTAQQGFDDSQKLINTWHKKNRQLYTVTPRFAITSTQEQLDCAGALFRSRDDLFMQTHLAENRDEIAFVKSLYPNHTSYLDVYDKAGLVGPRAIFGHSIHMSERDLTRCYEAGCSFSHCPTSNLFLGSGAFKLFHTLSPHRPIPVGLGTDVGAGTSPSLLATMGEAYKVSLLLAGEQRLHAIQAFWLATTGGAEALHLSDKIGSIAPGMEADLCVMDLDATPLLSLRMKECSTLAERLFVLMTLGDDRCIKATWVNGHPIFERDRADQIMFSHA